MGLSKYMYVSGTRMHSGMAGKGSHTILAYLITLHTGWAAQDEYAILWAVWGTVYIVTYSILMLTGNEWVNSNGPIDFLSDNIRQVES